MCFGPMVASCWTVAVVLAARICSCHAYNVATSHVREGRNGAMAMVHCAQTFRVHVTPAQLHTAPHSL